MDPGSMGLLFTVLVFGALGWFLAARRSRPPGMGTLVVLVLVALVGGFIGTGTRLLDAFGFLVPLNWAIVACSSGAFVGSLLRIVRREGSESP